MNVFIFKLRQTKDEFVKRVKSTFSNEDYIQVNKLALKWYTHMLYQTNLYKHNSGINCLPTRGCENPAPGVAKIPFC